MKKTGSFKVIIVEDDIWVCKEIRRLVSGLGHEVVAEASNGTEAIEVVCAQKPDVVFMDIEMPEMNGIEASRIIQKTCPVPIVMLTAYESGDLLEQASSVGVGAYLIKPANVSEIDRAITIAVARHGDLVKLKSALDRERLLIREMYHRVGNNMAMIKTFLYLQAKSSRDKNTMDALHESENRVQTMLAIHKLLQSGDDSLYIEFNKYLTSIATDLHRSLVDSSGNIGLIVNVDDIRIDSETAMSCGLIVNELITNAIKYAFPQGHKGKIRLTVKALGGGLIELSISDDGVGLPAGVSLDKTATLGMEIVRSFVEQINGKLEIVSSGGTQFRVTFSEREGTLPGMGGTVDEGSGS